MKIEQAIKKAIEGGWLKNILKNYTYEVFGTSCIEFFDKETGAKVMIIQIAEMLLDPQFWQCLGKAMGWEEVWRENNTPHIKDWKVYWHELIDHLAEGKTIEKYFEELKE